MWFCLFVCICIFMYGLCLHADSHGVSLVCCVCICSVCLQLVSVGCVVLFQVSSHCVCAHVLGRGGRSYFWCVCPLVCGNICERLARCGRGAFSRRLQDGHSQPESRHFLEDLMHFPLFCVLTGTPMALLVVTCKISVRNCKNTNPT